jgi:hypothetical protein
MPTLFDATCATQRLSYGSRETEALRIAVSSSSAAVSGSTVGTAAVVGALLEPGIELLPEVPALDVPEVSEPDDEPESLEPPAGSEREKSVVGELDADAVEPLFDQLT